MSSRHENRHADGDGGGGSSPYDVFEDRDSQIQKVPLDDIVFLLRLIFDYGL